MILLLDGWNELDAAARKRLAAQVTRLKAELPELGLLISTRKQALDVPVDGTRINLLPLSETQQVDIAQALRDDAGVRMVDQAWRTPGVRELVTTPLYLTALLALPEGAPFPTTKEEVLRRFVAVHEEDKQRVEALAEVTHGLHKRFLEDLAVTATRAANTTIAETVARKSVSEMDGALVAEGQITEKPQPKTVLEALVSHHVLMRVGDPAGYSFQHQQFQEWYASHFVERLMLASIGDAESRDNLKADVLNQSAGMGRTHSLRVRAADARRPKTAAGLRRGDPGRIRGRSHSRRRDDLPFDRRHLGARRLDHSGVYQALAHGRKS